MNLLVVNYHYFRETTYASGIYPTNQNALDQQLAALESRYQWVDQATLVQWLAQQQFPEGDYCLLTFDDGLKEQMTAFRYLKGKGVPAIFYVPTEPIRRQTVLPTHQLHYVRTRFDDEAIYHYLERYADIGTRPMDTAAIQNQYRYDAPVAARVKYYLNFMLSEQDKNHWIRQMLQQSGLDEQALARELYLDETDLRELADADALGSHGSAHIPLATLPCSAAAQDILDSTEYLAAVTGRPILSFSYPFGGPSAVSPTLAPALEQAGIRFAFTMQRGINTPEQFQNPLFLRRVDTNDAPGGKKPLPEFL